MSRLVASLAVVCAVALSACGGSQCARLTAANDRVFVQGSTCSATSGGTTLAVTRSSATTATCEANVGKCTSADNQILSAFTDCVEKVTPCSAGNEKAASDGMTACGIQTFDLSTGMSKLSTDCQAAIK